MTPRRQRRSGVDPLHRGAAVRRHIHATGDRDRDRRRGDLMRERARLDTPLCGTIRGRMAHVTGNLPAAERAALADSCGESLTQSGLMLDLTSWIDVGYAEAAGGERPVPPIQ